MARQIITDLDDPRERRAALRHLKNDIIGHEQQKQKWIALGVLGRIADILRAYCSAALELDGPSAGGPPTGEQLDVADQEVCLQAITVVGSLASGGSNHLRSLREGRVIESLVSMLAPSDFTPTVVLASLRSLNTIADHASLQDPEAVRKDGGLLSVLYTGRTLANLAMILRKSVSSVTSRQQLVLAASLVWKTCFQEDQREKIASAGILEALAAQLASLLRGAETRLMTTQPVQRLDADVHQAPLALWLSPVLQAVASIITDSKDRILQFVCAPALARIYSWPEDCPDAWREPSVRLTKQPLGFTRQADAKHACTVLPPLHCLASLAKQANGGRSPLRSLTECLADNGSIKDEDETPLVGWLLDVIRTETGLARLMAAWVLAELFRAGLTSSRRERTLSMLLIPVVARMLENEVALQKGASLGPGLGPLQNPSRLIKELAPKVLATLVSESPDLQRAAAEAGAIRRLSQLLKQSHDPLPAAQSSLLWSASGTKSERNLCDRDGPPNHDAAGLTPDAYHVLQVRESVLSALSAMASSRDEYRKSIIDNGVVPFVIESLKQNNGSVASATNTRHSDGAATRIGNPAYVLLAACAAAQALSRSVSTLRTSLTDAGLAMPLYALLTNPDVGVQTAATAAIANIVLEFSPMRETVIDAGALKVLCEHAHSPNAKLKLNSIWALTHLVHSAPNKLKITCLEQLGPEWLMEVLRHGTNTNKLPASSGHVEEFVATIGLGTPNAAGEQVDLLNAVDTESQMSGPDPSEGGEYDELDDDDEVNMIDSIGALSRPQEPAPASLARGRSHFPSTASHRHQAGRPSDAELDRGPPADGVDLAVQHQGLGFIRNFICGPDSSEMIDCVFQQIGQERFFELLTSLLRPRSSEAPPSDRRQSRPAIKYMPPPTEVVTGVCYILVHLAAGLPRHRQILVGQTELLKAFIALLTHTVPEVRVCCTWIVINLTWTEDQGDKSQSRGRAAKLANLGVMGQLQRLEADHDLDVRERTKQAVQQMSDLLQR